MHYKNVPPGIKKKASEQLSYEYTSNIVYYNNCSVYTLYSAIRISRHKFKRELRDF